MKNTLNLLILLALFATSCKKDSEEITKATSKVELLTSNSSKSWQLFHLSYEREDQSPSCKLSSVRNSDNFFIFKKDGGFVYDNGEITEDPEDDQCGDLAYLLGTWKFSAAEDSLMVTVDKRVDDGDTTTIDETRLLKGLILSLTSDELKVSQSMMSTADTVTFKAR